MVRRRSKVALVVATALAAAGLPGCSVLAHLSTEASVRGDLDALLARPNLTVTVGLGMTAAQLRSVPGSGTVSTADAARLAGDRLVYSIGSGDGTPLRALLGGRADPHANYSVALSKDGNEPIQLLVTGGQIYGRLRFSLLARDFGLGGATAASVSRGLALADAHVPGLAALGRGSWVEVTRSELAPLRALARRASSPASRSSAGEVAQLRTALSTAFADHASLHFLGSSGGRREYSIVVRLAPLAAALLGSSYVRAVTGNRSASAISGAIRSIGHRSLVAHLYASGGRLQEIEVDLAQFRSGVAARRHPIPLIISLSDAPPIATPAAATVLQIRPLVASLAHLSTVGGSSGVLGVGRSAGIGGAVGSGAGTGGAG